MIWKIILAKDDGVVISASMFRSSKHQKTLVAAGAKLHLRKLRALTAADLIQRRSGPEFLVEACEVRVEACQRVSLLARGWVEMQF